MAIKMDGHTITSLQLKASDGSEVTKQLTEEGTIPTPTATKQITANGTYDVKSFASAEVNVGGEAPTLIAKEITENGNYNASADGADGYSSVSVNVSGGGESTTPWAVKKGSVTKTTTDKTLTINTGVSAISLDSLVLVQAIRRGWEEIATPSELEIPLGLIYAPTRVCPPFGGVSASMLQNKSVVTLKTDATYNYYTPSFVASNGEITFASIGGATVDTIPEGTVFDWIAVYCEGE